MAPDQQTEGRPPPPHDLGAERACLSTIFDTDSSRLYDPLEVLAALLRPEHFYSDEHGSFFRAALALRSAGEPVDAVAISSWLLERGRFDTGTERYIAEIRTTSPVFATRAQIEHHAHTVLDRWRQRQITAICLRAEIEGRLPVGDVGAWMSGIAAELAAVATAAKPKPPPRSWAQRVDGALAVMARRAEGAECAIRTRWNGVNGAMRGGLWPGLYTLTSATGTGKTQWGLDVALYAATGFAAQAQIESKNQGKEVPPDRVAYVALELGDTDVTARLMGLMVAEHIDSMRAAGVLEYEIRDTGLATVKWSDFFYGHEAANAPGSAAARLASASALVRDRLATLPFHLEEQNAIGWSYRNLETLYEEQRPRLIVLDYAQLAGAPADAREELRQTIGNVAKMSRDIARRPNGPAILVLSSTARENYKLVDGTDGGARLGPPNDPRRLIGLGKEAGELEFTADCVLALAAEPLPEAFEAMTGEAVARALAERVTWLAVAKGRGFPVGWVPMHFDGSRYTERPASSAAPSPAVEVDWRAAAPSPTKRDSKRGTK